MTQQTQSEATINAVINFAKDQGIEATPFETIYKDVLTLENRKAIGAMIYEGLVNETITMTAASKEKFANDDKALRRYVTGLLNDRLRKAKALNGNTKYEHKEPGKLTNARDPQLKALNQVLNLETTKEEDKPAILEAIAKRQAEVDASKTKKVVVDYDALPPELRAKLKV